ncbi:MAG: alpha/beta hydrolase-fold protein [Phycisphaerae bacterium]|nr:alpha/beta hydrolase-fold protein [Phycisphaerae bacterium]
MNVALIRTGWLMMLVLGLVVAGCGDKPAAAPTIFSAEADKPLAAATTIFDIPRVPEKTVDAADWGNVGFRVAAMVDTDYGTAAGEFHAARCRLGWNDEGLLIYMDVRDATPAEGAKIWEGDCVEIFVGREAAGNFDRIQYLIAPGRTAEFNQPRIQFISIHLYGDRWDDAPPEGSKYASRTTEDGYAIELLIPWTALGVTPAVGLELGVQLQTGDMGSSRAQFTRLAPQIAGPRKPVDLQRIRLAEAGAGSAPVLAAIGREMVPVTVTADSYRPADAALRVVADGSFAGKTATVEIDGKAVGHVEFGQVQSGWTEGLMTWPMSLAGGKSPQSATVVLPGGGRATLALGDMLASRRAQFNALEFTFHPWVFAGENLPQCGFKQPMLADILSGFNYTIKTRYFDADAKPVEKADKPGRYGAVVEITALGETKTRFFTLYRVADGNALNWGTWGGTNLRVRFENMPEGFGVNPKVWTDDPSRIFGSEFKWFLRGSLDSEGFFAAMLSGLSELPEDVIAGQVPLRPSQSSDASHHAYVVKLKQAISDKPVYPYIMIKPKTYDTDTAKRWPLLVHLHGAGGRHLPLETLWREGANSQAWIREDSPFIVVSPLCPENEWWQPAAVMSLVDQLIATMRVDPDRVYLTGISMGGFGTWNTAASYSDRFAAIVPLCGGMDPEQAVWLKDMPIWAFHGDADNIVPVEYTRGPINRLREANGKTNGETAGKADGDTGVPHIKYTEMPGVDHFIGHVYNNREIYDWLLQQRRPAKP